MRSGTSPFWPSERSRLRPRHGRRAGSTKLLGLLALPHALTPPTPPTPTPTLAVTPAYPPHPSALIPHLHWTSTDTLLHCITHFGGGTADNDTPFRNDPRNEAKNDTKNDTKNEVRNDARYEPSSLRLNPDDVPPMVTCLDPLDRKAVSLCDLATCLQFTSKVLCSTHPPPEGALELVEGWLHSAVTEYCHTLPGYGRKGRKYGSVSVAGPGAWGGYGGGQGGSQKSGGNPGNGGGNGHASGGPGGGGGTGSRLALNLSAHPTDAPHPSDWLTVPVPLSLALTTLCTLCRSQEEELEVMMDLLPLIALVAERQPALLIAHAVQDGAGGGGGGGGGVGLAGGGVGAGAGVRVMNTAGAESPGSLADDFSLATASTATYPPMLALTPVKYASPTARSRAVQFTQIRSLLATHAAGQQDEGNPTARPTASTGATAAAAATATASVGTKHATVTSGGGASQRRPSSFALQRPPTTARSLSPSQGMDSPFSPTGDRPEGTPTGRPQSALERLARSELCEGMMKGWLGGLPAGVTVEVMNHLEVTAREVCGYVAGHEGLVERLEGQLTDVMYLLATLGDGEGLGGVGGVDGED